VTGFTSQNLIDRELPLLATLKPDFVTVLIGVNDYVRGIPESTFVKNLRHILDSVAKSVDEKHIVLVTIPDYTRTPTGQRFGNATEASRTIDKFNQAIIREAESRGILVVDIFQISQMVTDDSSLTASDGLHPSGKQYKLWSDRIYQEITDRNLFH
jgi:acyl-CoA thioesterase-1